MSQGSPSRRASVQEAGTSFCPLEHFGVRTCFRMISGSPDFTFREAGKECPFLVGLARSQPFRHRHGPILGRVVDAFPFVQFGTDRVSPELAEDQRRAT